MQLYDELKAAGIQIDSYESDLYFPATPQALAILDKYPLQKAYAERFRNQAPPNVGDIWIDVPFAYLPFWSRKLKKN